MKLRVLSIFKTLYGFLTSMYRNKLPTFISVYKHLLSIFIEDKSKAIVYTAAFVINIWETLTLKKYINKESLSNKIMGHKLNFEKLFDIFSFKCKK